MRGVGLEAQWEITRTQTDDKDLECHGAESGLNSVGDGEPWKGFNQASDMIPPA